MKRDWNLLRWLLQEVESCEGGYPVVITKYQYNGTCYFLDIKDQSLEELCEHALLLDDAKLAIVKDLGRTYEGPAGVVIERLTMDGHDFIDAMRNESCWKAVMATIQEKGGAVTIGILIQLLSAKMKLSFGLS